MAFDDDLADAQASGRPFEVRCTVAGQKSVHYFTPEREAQIASDRATLRAAYLRTLRRQQVIEEAVRRIGEQLPGYDNVDDLRRLTTLASVEVITDSADPAWVEAKRLYQRHVQLRAQVVAASVAQLEATDPTDDALWAP